MQSKLLVQKTKQIKDYFGKNERTKLMKDVAEDLMDLGFDCDLDLGELVVRCAIKNSDELHEWEVTVEDFDDGHREMNIDLSLWNPMRGKEIKINCANAGGCYTDFESPSRAFEYRGVRDRITTRYKMGQLTANGFREIQPRIEMWERPHNEAMDFEFYVKYKKYDGIRLNDFVETPKWKN